MFDMICWSRGNAQRATRPLLLAFAALLVALLLALWPTLAERAWAGTIQVDGTVCTLAEAVILANTDTDLGSPCDLEDGALGAADTLYLLGSVHSIPLVTPFDYSGITAVPSIISDITIVGDDGGTTIERADGDLYRLFYITDDGRLTLNNVTITNFSLRSTSGGAILNTRAVTLTNSSLIANSAAYGGGLYNDGSLSSATLVNSHVLSNTAIFSGGGIFTNGGSATFTGSHFRFNKAGWSGGGIANAFVNGTQSVTITNSYIVSNTAEDDAGGLLNYDGSYVTVSNSYILSNSASNFGGGIVNTDASTLTISGSHINGNSALDDGGGLTNRLGSVASLTNSYVSVNSGNAGGGIANYDGSTLVITNSHLLTNTALDADGGALFIENSSATLTNTRILSNSAVNGGGIANNGGNLLIADSDFFSNTASVYGGGLHNIFIAITNLTSTRFVANSAAQKGGGISNEVGSTLIISGSHVISNTALIGGGINLQGETYDTIINTRILSNTAEQGGGLALDGFSKATLSGSTILSNTAIEGGGIYVLISQMSIYSSTIGGNSATTDGGGGSGINSVLILSESSLLSNQAEGNGGALYSIDGNKILMTDTNIIANSAGASGGGIYNVVVSNIQANGAKFLGNRAQQGGALSFVDERSKATIHDSCIVNNSEPAILNVMTNTVDLTGNWWGAPDGPSGFGPGSGDSVSGYVDFSGFETSALLDCPDRIVNLTFAKNVAPAGNLLPGQPITYTISVTNNDAELVAHKLFISDTLPAQFQLIGVSSSGAVITEEVNGFRISQVPAGAVAQIHLLGTIDVTLNADTPLHNTAFLSSTLLGLLADVATASIVVPKVSFNATTYNANEGAGNATVTLALDRANPYAEVQAEVQAEVLSTDTLNLLKIAAVQPVTLPAGSVSQTLSIPFADDEGVAARAIALALQNPVGAALGGNSSATVIINEDDQAGLMVLKSASVAQASAGELIIYTYQITNTGSVTLTIVANDDQLGAVAGLAGALAPLATRTATLSYTVQESDPVGTLENRVTVTGTSTLEPSLRVIVHATALLSIGAPTNLPEEENPTQRWEIFLPGVKNVP